MAEPDWDSFEPYEGEPEKAPEWFSRACGVCLIALVFGLVFVGAGAFAVWVPYSWGPRGAMHRFMTLNETEGSQHLRFLVGGAIGLSWATWAYTGHPLPSKRRRLEEKA